MFVLFLSLLLSSTVEGAPAGLHSENIFGAPLAKCDRAAHFIAHPEQKDVKYPTTGYYRNDECTASAADAGAHFVCVKMPSATTSAGDSYSTFWTETGQAQSPEMAVGWPKPGPWCICMWAFARMFASHPSFIDMLTCDATNQWVITNYDLGNPAQASALHAVCGKCGVAADEGAAQALRDKCHAAHAQFGTTPTARRALGTAGAGAEAEVEKEAVAAAHQEL